MAGYARLEDVYAQLLIVPGGEDDPIVQRVGRLNESLSRVFDQKVGMTWADEPVVASTRTVEAYGWSGVRSLALPVPVRSVSGIEVGGTWDGSTWTDGDALTVDQWRLPSPDARGNIWEIWVSDSAPFLVTPEPWNPIWSGPFWSGPVRVTAIWGDNPGDAVPAEVADALTWLVAHTYREETSSPVGQIGPDGLIVTIREPWKSERLTTVIERYRLVAPLAV